MTNPTSNFGWVMPDPTDLVTNLPADFEVFGQAVDTSMADLKGGTTGQILSKASATDMDFTWIANDQGDITGITATSPLTGGGTSGAVTVGIQAASTTQSGAVQLSDSTSTTSSVLAATPTAVKAAYDKASTAATTSVAGIVQLSDSTSTTSSVLASTPTATKSAYDLANGAIAKTTVTTAGDIIYRNATVPTRLGIGTAGQVLTVNTGATAPEWKTPTAAASGLTLIKTVNYTTASTTSTDFNSQFTSTYKFYFIEIKCVHSVGATNLNMQLSYGATTKAANYYGSFGNMTTGSAWSGAATTNGSTCKINYLHTTGNSTFINITGVGNTTEKPTWTLNGFDSQNSLPNFGGYMIDDTATKYDGFVISPASGTITGTISLYGLAAS